MTSFLEKIPTGKFGSSPRLKVEPLTCESLRVELNAFMENTLQKAFSELGSRVLEDFRKEFGREGDLADIHGAEMEEKDLSAYYQPALQYEGLRRLSRLTRPFSAHRPIKRYADRASASLAAPAAGNRLNSMMTRLSRQPSGAEWWEEAEHPSADRASPSVDRLSARPSQNVRSTQSVRFSARPSQNQTRFSAVEPKSALHRATSAGSLHHHRVGHGGAVPRGTSLESMTDPESSMALNFFSAPKHIAGTTESSSAGRMSTADRMSTSTANVRPRLSAPCTPVRPLPHMLPRERSWLPDESAIMSESQSLLDVGYGNWSDDDPPFARDRTSPGVTSPTEDALSIVQELVRQFVESATFEKGIFLLILLNALMLGVETDLRGRVIEEQDKTGSVSVLLTRSCALAENFEITFTILFSCEILLRICAYWTEFMTGPSWRWNLFDFLVVALQVMEQVVHFLKADFPINPSFLRLFRSLRLIRITRLVRIVRYIEELHTIVSSIMSSMMALFWTLSLLMMVIYIFSVFFTQVVMDNLDRNTTNNKELVYWYGRLPRTMLTMFEVIVGGVSWDEVATPLIVDISPLMGVLLCMYIAFCVFAMMNMATGVFVERATRKAQEDKDTYTANHISDLFFGDNTVNKDEVTWEVFCHKMDCPDMQEYFKAINVDPSEAKGLFQLLDADASGTINGEELVNGCLRLRGGAKALELSLLMHETARMHDQMLEHHSKFESQLSTITRALTGKDWHPGRSGSTTATISSMGSSSTSGHRSAECIRNPFDGPRTSDEFGEEITYRYTVSGSQATSGFAYNQAASGSSSTG